MNVLFPMVVTAAVTHFEMSALNARALRNTAEVYVNAVDVEPEQEKKQRNPKLSENHKFVEQAIEQEEKVVEVGRTPFHVRHPTRDPL